ncbi:MAG: glutathione S-transferase N-terminal domain-containing protein [Pseudomonadota bacterium]
MIELYTWSTPNGRKVSILLEELGIPYSVHPIDIGKGEQHAPAFLEIAPNNRIPAIRDTESGLTLMESGAIMLHLAETHGRFIGTGETRARAIEWLMWQMGGLGPMAGQAHHFLHYNRGKAPYAEERYAAETKRLYGVLDRRLAAHGHVAGEYTIADMAIFPWVARHPRQDIDLAAFPAVQSWYRSLAERPAVVRGYNVPIAEEMPQA